MNSNDTEREHIYVFVKHISDLLNDRSVPDVQILDDPEIIDGFKSLPFEMDCGNAFKEKYGEFAFSQSGELAKIIDSIDDVYLLGSAFYSQWRYYNHWAYSSIRGEEPKKWFNIIMNRIMALTKNNE